MRIGLCIQIFFRSKMSNVETLRMLRSLTKEDFPVSLAKLTDLTLIKELVRVCISELWTLDHLSVDSGINFLMDHYECVHRRSIFCFSSKCKLRNVEIDDQAVQLQKYCIYLHPIWHSARKTPTDFRRRYLFDDKNFGTISENFWSSKASISNRLHISTVELRFLDTGRDIPCASSACLDSGSTVNSMAIEKVIELSLQHKVERLENPLMVSNIAGDVVKATHILKTRVETNGNCIDLTFYLFPKSVFARIYCIVINGHQLLQALTAEKFFNLE